MNFIDITLISSRQNQKIKHWLKLNTTQGVKKFNSIIIEGLRSCVTAWKNEALIEAFLFSDDSTGKHIYESFLNLHQQKDDAQAESDFIRNSFRIEPELFNALADSKQPQGIIFIIEKPNLYKLSDWLAKKQKKIEKNQSENKQPLKLALLDQLKDPGNLGTIIRTANAFDFPALILYRGTVDPYNPKVMRSMMGSLFALDLIELDSYQELADLAKQYKLEILVSDLDGLDLPTYRSAPQKAGFVLAIGNEAHGVDFALKKLADQTLTIPMPGNAESLNAATAFAILAYQLNQA